MWFSSYFALQNCSKQFCIFASTSIFYKCTNIFINFMRRGISGQWKKSVLFSLVSTIRNISTKMAHDLKLSDPLWHSSLNCNFKKIVTIVDGTQSLAPLFPRVSAVLIFPVGTAEREQSAYACMGQVPFGFSIEKVRVVTIVGSYYQGWYRNSIDPSRFTDLAMNF